MESSRKALGEALGKERRDRVLSALYIVRQDAVSVVRQSAIHIWKALVHNTPRTGMAGCRHQTQFTSNAFFQSASYFQSLLVSSYSFWSMIAKSPKM